MARFSPARIAALIHPRPENAEIYGDLTIARVDGPARVGPSRPVVKIWRGKQSAPYANYSFRNDDEREAYIVREKLSEDARLKYKAVKKAEAAAERAAGNPFKVGDLVGRSWGYDQTQYDCYQIVEVLARSCRIRKIACRALPGTQGAMSQSVTPVKDSFVGESKLARLSGKHLCYKGDYLSPTSEGSSHYTSWYA